MTVLLCGNSTSVAFLQAYLPELKSDRHSCPIPDDLRDTGVETELPSIKIAIPKLSENNQS